MTKLEELERHLGFAQQALRGAVGSFNRAVTPAERMAASVYIKSCTPRRANMSEMIEADLTCPFCGGKGKSQALVDGVRDGRRCGWVQEMKCFTCKGSGKVSAEYAARIKAGAALRDDRRSRGLNIREEAKRLGIDPRELNDREQGRIREVAQ